MLFWFFRWVPTSETVPRPATSPSENVELENLVSYDRTISESIQELLHTERLGPAPERVLLVSDGVPPMR